MKNLATVILIFLALAFKGYSQTENYNLDSQNLHKKVRKTIEHYYKYDDESGGFVRTSIDINRYNDDENLIETYSLYNSKYSDNEPVKKLYNYNADDLLISTKDISDSRGAYSTEYKFTYDRDDYLIKSESVYKDGSKFYSVFKNDKKGRILNKKEYNKDNKLTADVNYSYNGGDKTENRTSFSTKDGSIIGTYTSIFKDNKLISYKSESTYGNSITTYEYDKEGNTIASNYSGTTNSKSTYDYEYDKKDNWIKKHYRSGKYQYFYFREIHFDNGDVTGSTNFDEQFINRLGNFGNVAVVELKKVEKKENPITTNTNSSVVNDKTWDFDYVYVGDAVKKLAGTVALKNINSNSLQIGTEGSFTISFSSSTFNFNLKVNTFTTLDDKYEYTFSNENNESGLLWIYKNLKPLKDTPSGASFDVNGLFLMKEKDGSSMSFYLK